MKALVPLITGVPLSVTRTTTVLVLGPWASVGRNDTWPLAAQAVAATAAKSYNGVGGLLSLTYT